MDNVATVKHKDRSYMGMLEYKKEDETVLIKNLIMGRYMVIDKKLFKDSK